jgi:hypothetical protein
MTPTEIPANIDHRMVLRQLNDWGYRDYRIEAICGFSIGYVAQLKCGAIQQMTYQRAARLWNFWVSEHSARSCVAQ